jgi:hypothetical protein
MKVTSKQVELGDYWEWDRLARSEGWTDGLPVAPPTKEKVLEILDHLQRSPSEIIGAVPPLNGKATVEQIAIQCAMAGARPEHVPVVIAALEALLDPHFNLHGVQCTTNPCAPLVVVSGPIVESIGMNVGCGAFGGGGHANAAIGRAVRLVLWNIGGGRPGVTDMSPLGHPAKYAFCAGENHAQSPWTGIQTDFGLDESQSAVTVFACTGPYPALVCGDAQGILTMIGESLPSTTINMFHSAGQLLIVFSIRPAEELAKGGISKQDVKNWVFENARLNVGTLRRHGLGHESGDTLSTYWGTRGLEKQRPRLDDLADDVELPLVLSPDDIHVLVTGGDTQWWAGFCPGWGNYGGYAITRAIE